MDRVWITWETQRRNRALARAFSATLLEFDESARSPLLRYLLSILKTVRGLLRERPQTVFTQNPSIVLTTFVAVLRCFWRFTFVIDAHNGALQKFRWLGLGWLGRWCLHRADLVIVSNRHLIPHGVKNMISLPDPLPPRTPRSFPVSSGDPIRATLISTFKEDEPIESVIRGVLRTALPYTLAITGRRSGAGELLRFEGEKIRFTDFLPQEEYEALLGASDLIIDLTTHQNCLVCGAYEGLSLGIPLLLSDSPATREYFPLGCLYTDNTEQGVQCALELFFEHRLQFSHEILCLYPLLQTRWEALFKEAITRILYLEGRECETHSYQTDQLVESASHLTQHNPQ